MNSIESAIDRSTTAIAAGATVSPFWLPYLQGVSDGAALVLPILGAAWIIMQMYFHIKKNRTGK